MHKINYGVDCLKIYKILILIIFMIMIIFLMKSFGIINIIQRVAKLELNASISNRISQNPDSDFIRWMEFNIPVEILEHAYNYDINSFKTDYSFSWIELLAYTAAKNWGKFDENSKEIMSGLVNKLKNGENILELSNNLRLYNFYFKSFSAVLGSFIGLYEIDGEIKYGLKVFSPIASGYYYKHYDDFGQRRDYGYRRRHLGNDIFGEIGIPIIAIESGIVESLGWNQYGGWRVGIRSFDSRRYFYYAHLKKDRPFAEGLEIGSIVQAGDVIGYLGKTGYSVNENVNNINIPHLHFGMQIIFDESQKDSSNQIWIDTYNIIKFLKKNRMQVEELTNGEFIRQININIIDD